MVSISRIAGIRHLVQTLGLNSMSNSQKVSEMAKKLQGAGYIRGGSCWLTQSAFGSGSLPSILKKYLSSTRRHKSALLGRRTDGESGTVIATAVNAQGKREVFAMEVVISDTVLVERPFCAACGMEPLGVNIENSTIPGALSRT